MCAVCAVSSDGVKLHVSKWFLSTSLNPLVLMIFLALKTARVPDLEISGEVQITDLHNPLRVDKGHNCDVAKRWC